MSADPIKAALRSLPSVNAVLGQAPLPALADTHGRTTVTAAARAVLKHAREALKAGAAIDSTSSGLAARAADILRADLRPRLAPVFNLTGTVLHTNLGRAPLAEAARDAVAGAAGACNIEYDLDRGARGARDSLVEDRLCAATGADAAIVVNNNAAAVLLVLNALAVDREVIVSRGELIEIGDAFRMPDIMTRAGCTLREVGTTNRTHEHDYRRAIGERSGLVMRVHPSNYIVEGFAGTVGEADLAAIAHAHDLPFAVDLGSGSLVELADYGLPHEPTPSESLAAGADVVTFSGDKLLGGPQAGLIVGKHEIIARIRRNPLKRALRCDKLIMAALEATLALYARPERLADELPALRLLARPRAAIAALGDAVAADTRAALASFTDDVSLVDCQSQIGSGSLPVDRLPSVALRIRPPERCDHPGSFLRGLVSALASLPVPVIGRIRANALLLDLRCLEDSAAFTRNLAALARPARGHG